MKLNKGKIKMAEKTAILNYDVNPNKERFIHKATFSTKNELKQQFKSCTIKMAEKTIFPAKKIF